MVDYKALQNGWLGIKAGDEAFEKAEKEFIKFQISGKGPDKPGPSIWRLAKRVNDNKNLPTWYQQVGDCCSMGATQVIDYLQIAQVVSGKDGTIEYHPVFPPYIYGISRTAKDCGNRSLYGDGSTGAWTATACKNHGVLFCDDEGVPKYSGSIARSWGSSGPPAKFQELAKDNCVKSIARLTTVDELRDALMNYHFCTIASSWGFDVGKRAGYKIYSKSGSWAHQMCFIAWMDDPFPAAFRLNSWGDSTGPSLHGEPLGGAWQPAESIKKELTTGVELYAYSQFDGFPAADSSRYSFI